MAKDFMAAFLRERENAEENRVSNLDTRKITLLSVVHLSPSQENFYNVEDVSDLKASIAEHGLMQPIVTNNGFEIISGHRRWEAFRQLYAETGNVKYKMIPAIVMHPQDPIELDMMLIEANSTARVLTSYELAEQARRYDELLQRAKTQGYDYSGRRRDIVAKMMQVSPSRIARIPEILTAHWNVCRSFLEKGNLM